MGIRLCCARFFDFLIVIGFMLIRCTIIASFFYFTFPQITQLIVYTYSIIWQNWWKDDSHNNVLPWDASSFVLSDNTFELILCWILWLPIFVLTNAIIIVGCLLRTKKFSRVKPFFDFDFKQVCMLYYSVFMGTSRSVTIHNFNHIELMAEDIDSEDEDSLTILTYQDQLN